MDRLPPIPDFGLSWLDASGADTDIVLSTRVRLARNLQGYPYVSRAGHGEREIVFRTVSRVVDRSSLRREAVYLRMTELSERARQDVSWRTG